MKQYQPHELKVGLRLFICHRRFYEAVVERGESWEGWQMDHHSSKELGPGWDEVVGFHRDCVDLASGYGHGIVLDHESWIYLDYDPRRNCPQCENAWVPPGDYICYECRFGVPA